MAYKYSVLVNGVVHDARDLKYLHTSQLLYDKLSTGNAVAAKLDMTFWPKKSIPSSGYVSIIPRFFDDGENKWKSLGVFWLDTIDKEGTATKIEAYDAMLRADRLWEPRQELEFPMSEELAAQEIAQLMSVSLDPRCVFWSGGKVDYPADRTLREVLCDIAGANLGNWIITSGNKLLLVPLFESMPPETNYLVDEKGEAITIGGVRITV